MAMKWRVMGLAVVLGAIAGGVIALVRTPPRTTAVAIESSSTNAVAQVAATNAVVREVEKRGGGVQGNNRMNEPSTPKPPNTQTPKPAKPPRKPVTNDPKIPKARQVLLANRRIAVAAGRSFPKKFSATQTPTARGTAPYVVISELPVSRDVRIQAVANGAKVVGFLPNNALLVEADAQALKNLEEDVLFLAAVEFEPTDKIQRALLDDKGETVEANVVLLNPKDVDAISKFIADNGGTPLSNQQPATNNQKPATLCARMPRELVGQLAGKAEVKWIERHVRLKLNNDVAVKPGLMNVSPVWNNYGLTGAGQIVTTSDSGIDTGNLATLHADLTNAVIGFRTSYDDCDDHDVDGHGTHTAGSIVGDGTRSGGKIRGTAYGAKLWAWFCQTYEWNWRTRVWEAYISPLECFDAECGVWGIDAAALFRPVDGGKEVDAHVHSASWGGGSYGGYSTEYCKVLDNYVWHHPDFLPVFSAGNDGSGEGTVGEPATAKNVLAVGASENLRPTLRNDKEGWYAENPVRIATFSSCGPCADGRVKPDIVAPGTYVLSCLSSQASRDKYWNADAETYANYQYMGGTSMACPLAAGTAALVREWLAKYRSRAKPSAALVKAVLTGGANGGERPDNAFGWGRVDLGESVFPTNGLAVYMKDWLPFRAGSNFTFRVTTTNAAPLNVQLVWVDYPGDPVATKMLCNDLDLSVGAAGQTWLGNGGTEPDDVNNVESVRIRLAAARAYDVRVFCKAVPYEYDDPAEGGGAAAIYIRGAFDPADVSCAELDGAFLFVR